LSAQVSPLLVRRSHFAVSDFLGCVVFPWRTTLATVKRTANPLVELGLPKSITQQYLAGRPQPTSSSHGLSLPSALEESRVHLPQACLPTTFRLQGLVTLMAVFSPRSRAGSVSHRQRSWDSPFGAFSFRKVSDPFPGGRTHLPFRPPVYPHRGAGRLDRPRFLGFSPSGSP
jgi:hypothetical protein